MSNARLIAIAVLYCGAAACGQPSAPPELVLRSGARLEARTSFSDIVAAREVEQPSRSSSELAVSPYPSTALACRPGTNSATPAAGWGCGAERGFRIETEEVDGALAS